MRYEPLAIPLPPGSMVEVDTGGLNSALRPAFAMVRYFPVIEVNDGENASDAVRKMASAYEDADAIVDCESASPEEIARLKELDGIVPTTVMYLMCETEDMPELPRVVCSDVMSLLLGGDWLETRAVNGYPPAQPTPPWFKKSRAKRNS